MKLALDSLSLVNLQSTFHTGPRAFPPFLTTPSSHDYGVNNFYVAYTTPAI